MIHRFSRSNQEPFVNDSKRSDIEQQYPLVQLHDDQSIDHTLVAKLAEEIGWVSGVLIDVHLRVDNHNINRIIDEDTNPVYWAPKQIKGYFDPPPPVQEIKKWGVDIDMKPEIYFPISVINKECGRLLRTGDVLIIPNYEPVNGVERFRITSVAPEGNYKYGWVWLKCYCGTLPNDITIQPFSEGQSSSGGLDG